MIRINISVWYLDMININLEKERFEFALKTAKMNGTKVPEGIAESFLGSVSEYIKDVSKSMTGQTALTIYRSKELTKYIGDTPVMSMAKFEVFIPAGCISPVPDYSKALVKATKELMDVRKDVIEPLHKVVMVLLGDPQLAMREGALPEIPALHKKVDAILKGVFEPKSGNDRMQYGKAIGKHKHWDDICDANNELAELLAKLDTAKLFELNEQLVEDTKAMMKALPEGARTESLANALHDAAKAIEASARVHYLASTLNGSLALNIERFKEFFQK